MDYRAIGGGVCAARGFLASGIHCGVRKNAEKPDLALIYSQAPCAAAGVFTKNRVKAAPVLLDMELLKAGRARAVAVNSGNANACALDDMENAGRMCRAAAAALGLAPGEVLVGSTGVIGQRLNIEAIEAGLPKAASALSAEGSDAAARAIMTTDTVKKELAVELDIDGKAVRLGAIAKGSGMIHPNMGTMLCYATTDCAISPAMLRKALLEAVSVSFNRVSVDGDTSTNDSCIILANGLAGNRPIDAEGEAYRLFAGALTGVFTELARMVAADGEGATHLITCRVEGAENEEKAVRLAKSIINSPLTKAAVFGRDANWGRVLCAMGYSGAEFNPELVDIDFASAAGRVAVCEKGRGLAFDEALAKSVLAEKEVVIEARLNEGPASAVCWGCDLTYDYVRINGDYRT